MAIYITSNEGDVCNIYFSTPFLCGCFQETDTNYQKTAGDIDVTYDSDIQNSNEHFTQLELESFSSRNIEVKMASFIKTVLLSVSVIDGIRLWGNGLHQNGLYLYKLFVSAGYTPIFIFSKKPDSDEAKQYNIISFSEYNQNPFNVHSFIELGINCTENQRTIFKNNGAKLFKLFLGNDLNYDIESPIYFQDNGIYHTPGSHGTMLLSPHYYYYSQEYISTLFDVYPNAKIAPYVWDSSFLHDLIDIYKWSDNCPFSFSVMEPNISFQKCSLVPIMICESYYRANSDKMEGVVVINGKKLTDSKYFLTNVLSKLELYQSKRLFLIKRLTIREAATTFKQNIIVCHAVNNDYNYLFLEYLFMGFPVIHNYAMLKDYGYYYKGNDIEAGKQMIEYVIANHGTRLEAYKANCRQLFWKFSIYNPDNINGWKDILDSCP